MPASRPPAAGAVHNLFVPSPPKKGVYLLPCEYTNTCIRIPAYQSTYLSIKLLIYQSIKIYVYIRVRSYNIRKQRQADAKKPRRAYCDKARRKRHRTQCAVSKPLWLATAQRAVSEPLWFPDSTNLHLYLKIAYL